MGRKKINSCAASERSNEAPLQAASDGHVQIHANKSCAVTMPQSLSPPFFHRVVLVLEILIFLPPTGRILG
jgi:hypothetical protein